MSLFQTYPIHGPSVRLVKTVNMDDKTVVAVILDAFSDLHILKLT